MSYNQTKEQSELLCPDTICISYSIQNHR